MTSFWVFFACILAAPLVAVGIDALIRKGHKR